MPIHLSDLKTKSGHRVARAEFVTEVTIDEAGAFMRKTAPGTEYEGVAFLVTGNVTGISNAVKKALKPEASQGNLAPVAIVLTSAIARMLAGLMIRSSGEARSEYFKTEAEALAWLDGAITEFKANR